MRSCSCSSVRLKSSPRKACRSSSNVIPPVRAPGSAPGSPRRCARGLAGLRAHGLEVAYGLAALAYIAVEGVLVVALYRVLVRG